ncbi:hypothetical protein V6N11_070836 [Hibiscus sabdariffa]|uniref:Retrotransposon gag domain-containing protein n=1 Tax=Hibiscus sabdariffa TaxID=183260 RepID=A0ABR2N8H7_9ROSI
MNVVHIRDQKHELTPPRNRANPSGPIYDLDPEIGRTQRDLKRRVRILMERNGNNGQHPVDGQDPPAPAGGAIVPPIPQNNQQQPVMTVRDYLPEDLEGLNPAVTIPEFEAEHFELKPVMFNMLNTLGQFGGSPAENARQHLKSFLEICNSFKIHGVSNDVLKLKLFPYSLRDKAKAWMNNLPPGSLQSWTELCRSFLAKFSYNNMTDDLRNQITSFRQEDDEAMHEACECYRDLFRRCPMHGLPEWTQVSIFYNSVNPPTRMMLDASANGTLLDRPPREGLEILEKLAQNDYQHPTSRRGNMRRGTAQLESSDTNLAQISTLTNMVKNMQRQPNTHEVKAIDAFCRFPIDTEVAKGATHEQCKAIATRSGRVLEPKNNQRGTTTAQNKTPVVTDTPALVGTSAKAEEDHIDPTYTEEAGPTAEASQPEPIRPEKLEEIRPPPPFPQRLKKQKQDYQFKKFFDILKQVHINLPLVEALQQIPNYSKFLKDMVSRKKRIGEFKTAAATETCLALMHNKIPVMKTDPGSFTIECSIGHNYSTKALCDPDYEADENAPIILGRPFLATSRAIIDFDKDEMAFQVDNDQVKMKVFTTLGQLENRGKNKAIPNTQDDRTQKLKPYMGAHTERDKGVVFLRNA